jgi:hypothetical protein
MNVDGNGLSHSKFNIPYSLCWLRPMLSKELSAFMMQIVDGRFAATAGICLGDCLGMFLMWIVCEMSAGFLLFTFVMETLMPANRKQGN